MRFFAMSVAAGRGTRMGLERNKVLAPLCGEPVIARTVGDYTYTDNSDGTVTITNYGGSERNLTTPEELTAFSYEEFNYQPKAVHAKANVLPFVLE